jgi:hypothetical protein
MACPTGRCALRRFDGHGTNTYRPTNPEAAREFNSNLERMMAERSQQDSCWLQPAGNTAQPAGGIPGTGLLRQITPELSGQRLAAAAAKSTPAGNSAAAGATGGAGAAGAAGAAAADAVATAPCWSLSS